MILFGFGRVPGCLGLGALFVWDGWREGRTVSLPAGRLQGLSFLVVYREVVSHQRCAGRLQGLSFLVVSWEVVASALRWMCCGDWSFCVIFKFIFVGFWIIIMEKDGWPDWLPDWLTV